MQKQRRFARVALLLLLAGLFLAGCSGLDDLCVINRYPFAIVLRQQGGKTLTVPARSTLTFHGAGGYEGNGMDNIQIEDAHHKPLQTLSQYSPNVEKQDERFNGAATWSVTLGPSPTSSLFSTKPFSIGWIFAGAALFIAWVEWRAYRNEKFKQAP